MRSHHATDSAVFNGLLAVVERFSWWLPSESGWSLALLWRADGVYLIEVQSVRYR